LPKWANRERFFLPPHFLKVKGKENFCFARSSPTAQRVEPLKVLKYDIILSTFQNTKLPFIWYHTMESKKITIGDKVKARRLKLGITQDKLARKSDVPYTTLTKLESNVITKPTIQTVEKIAKGLEVSIDKLIK